MPSIVQLFLQSLVGIFFFFCNVHREDKLSASGVFRSCEGNLEERNSKTSTYQNFLANEVFTSLNDFVVAVEMG